MTTMSDCRRLARETIGPHLAVSPRWIMADFPRHTNVGDSLIWLGTRALMGELGLACSASFDQYNFPPRDRLAYPDDPVLLNGGGNFGDLYPGHHDLRLRVLHHFRGRRIVQMPETLNFSGTGSLDRTRDAIREHGDVVLLVRDAESERFARKHFFAEVHLAPDAALALPQDRPAGRPVADVVVLGRTDAEASGSDVAPLFAPEVEVVDWVDPPGGLLGAAGHRLRRRGMQVLTGPVRGWRGVLRDPTPVYDAYARWNYEHGRRLISRGRVLVSNRLHAHVFALLLGLPHVVVDDRYGKIHRVDAEWTRGVQPVRWATSLEEGAAIARQWALDLGGAAAPPR